MLIGGFERAQAEALDGGQDVVSGLGPAEGSWIGVDGLDVAEDGFFELSGGAMDTAAQLLFCEHGEEALDLVQPGGAGRREVDVPAGMACEPVADRRGLVGRVVVDHQVDVEVGRDVGLDGAQELKELSGPVTLEAAPDHFAGRDIEGREERRRPVALVIMTAPLRLTGPHGQQRLAAIQGLDLALLVDAEDQARSGGAK